MPNPAKTEAVLAQIFNFIILDYHKRKNIPYYSTLDYTSEAIDSIHKRVNEYINGVLLKNYQDMQKIFLLKEKFEIAGKIMEKGGKKLIIITAVKTKTKYIVLLPTGTIASLFSAMQDIVN